MTDDEIVFTIHALDAYAERVRPSLPSAAAALAELERLRPMTDRTTECPDWCAMSQDCEYLLVGEGIVFPLRRVGRHKLVATTCLIRAGLTHGQRRARNRRRAGRRRARRAIKLAERYSMDGRRDD